MGVSRWEHSVSENGCGFLEVMLKGVRMRSEEIEA